MVFYSESGKYTYAAHYLQAILSVPQLYEAILNAPGCPGMLCRSMFYFLRDGLQAVLGGVVRPCECRLIQGFRKQNHK